MQRESPSRPYVDLEDFRVSYCGQGRFQDKFFDDPDAWPCLTCNGRSFGFQYDAYEIDNEGRKSIKRIPCTVCRETGCGSKEDCEKEYDAEIAAWQAYVEEYNQLAIARRVALSKLTNTEIHALETLGVTDDEA